MRGRPRTVSVFRKNPTLPLFKLQQYRYTSKSKALTPYLLPSRVQAISNSAKSNKRDVYNLLVSTSSACCRVCYRPSASDSFTNPGQVGVFLLQVIHVPYYDMSQSTIVVQEFLGLLPSGDQFAPSRVRRPVGHRRPHS